VNTKLYLFASAWVDNLISSGFSTVHANVPALPPKDSGKSTLDNVE
jgi:hypothetical protein